jgi:hypothetical protein
MPQIPYGYCHCGCGQKTTIAPATERKRGYVKGKPYKFVKGHNFRCCEDHRGTLHERFWKRVKKTDYCWIWQGYTAEAGYGQIGFNNKVFSTHRISWMLNFGEIPEGLCVLHKCDHPPCVNPDHLFLGTRDDNSKDAVAKGRAIKGERVGTSKLTEKDITNIKSQKGIKSATHLSLIHNVNVSHIYKIWKGTRWIYH